MADAASIKASLRAAFRDYQIDGVPSSGDYEPDKSLIRSGLSDLVDYGANVAASVVSGVKGYVLLADLPTLTAADEGTLAKVEETGLVYRWDGATLAWVEFDDPTIAAAQTATAKAAEAEASKDAAESARDEAEALSEDTAALLDGTAAAARASSLGAADGVAIDTADGRMTVDLLDDDDSALVVGVNGRRLFGVDTNSGIVDAEQFAVQELDVRTFRSPGDLVAADTGEIEQILGERAWMTPDGRGLRIDPTSGEILATMPVRYDPAPLSREPTSETTPPRFIRDPSEIAAGDYSRAGAQHVGVATLGKTGSRWWAADWRSNTYPGESSGNYICVYYSDDDLETWSEFGMLTYPDDDLHKMIDPMFWTDPSSGELWLFFSVSTRLSTSASLVLGDGVLGVWSMVCANPAVSSVARTTWSIPRKMTRTGDPRRVVRLDGGWYIPVDLWNPSYYSYPQGRSGCVLHRFYPGERRLVPHCTLPVAGSPVDSSGQVSNFIETEIVQLSDGRWLATRRGDPSTYYCHSSDQGRTWTDWQSWTSVIGVDSTARIWLGRTASGRLMLVDHYNNTSRRDLRVRLSEDNGATWPYDAQVDPAEVAGDNAATTYPVAIIDGDRIAIIYDCGRTNSGELRVSEMSEAAIVAGTSSPVIHIVSSL